MASIFMDNLGKVYTGGVRAVTGVNLDIADGEMIVLVGPSGCGKSTLLRMVAGLETISEGSLKIGDRVVNNLEPADRDIAMVFQNYALYPHMTVYNNLAYGLKNRGFAKSEIQRRVNEAAQMLEIGQFLDRKPRQLSGGQRQRVAMGRALVREPAAFLFDEPLSNLDAKLRVQMRVEIRQLQKRLGTTSLYVTHDQLEALTMADRLVVLNGGQIEQVGTPMELYSRPATTFVAGFIGSPAMNMLSSEYLRGLVSAEALSHVPTQADLIGIRPEDLSLAAPKDGEISLTGTLMLLEPAGAESHLHLRFDGHDDMIVARLPHVPDVAEGAKLTFSLPRGKLHPFDRASGKRMA
ncbi:sn-glycerol-3-phosphate import ATP-binding protein UgpC [Roseinatronobacter bogoriensis]|uniref:sn-glycerol-3-phosphate import ATP-binding protein UgpC n=1 Tax=Roseinatronobacter bogoriensis subsp. barguzinensis TaxID=441209 RepID=A0A2K8KAN9_9RHOB|nr:MULTISPECIES: sn-glycerol-3-phosphate import ATP-binding protein UgpC [Rhodobaca]ATX66512.1 sn-glycerol-3-phosphate import ATP-binding protein UgpC [Rhodobaca barguzinensis]MBB4207675.1 sn-glycerol 3-phosphate transport system ATP-binding protein [Rhodobaca bogoriensis DSM 18756]TDY70829.1 carbohydrate ABC transporter ATP-binding protein (CUT1 family) [Rhodobaca bogoriensis DSM 18756]